MRQSPQYIVPLLLFLIAVLVGSLVWLQYTHSRKEGERADPNAQWTAGEPEQSPDDTGDADEIDEDSSTGETRRRDRVRRDESDRAARITSEPLRNPDDGEHKPDMDEIEKADAARQAAIDAMLAESAGAPRVGDPEGELGNEIGARVQWIVPPLKMLGLVTPAGLKGEGYLEGRSVSKSVLKDLEESGYDVSDTGKFSLLVGKVELPELSAPERALWSPLKGPPVIVSYVGQSIVANSDGWFAVVWNARESGKKETQISAAAAGFRMADSRESIPVDFRELRPSKGVTVKMERVPQVVFTVKYGPAQVRDCDTRAWLEIWTDDKSQSSALRAPGLFITARVPKSGMLTFLLPHAAPWTDRPVRFGASGDGWGLSSPKRLDLPEQKRSPTRDDAKEEMVIRLRAQVTLERAYTEKITGRCQQADRSAPGSFVRFEGTHTGVLTWSNSSATFDIHVNYEKGNWRQDLKIETPSGVRLSFGVAYDDRRLPFVELAAGGMAPAGPWVVTLPSEAAAQGRVWLYYDTRASSHGFAPIEVWAKKEGVLYAIVVSSENPGYVRMWSVPDVLESGVEVLLKFDRDKPYVPGSLRYGDLPEGVLGKTVDKPAEGAEEASKLDSGSRKGWIISAPD